MGRTWITMGALCSHLVHLNTTNADGAIVIDPEGAQPHYLLLRFATQTF